MENDTGIQGQKKRRLPLLVIHTTDDSAEAGNAKPPANKNQGGGATRARAGTLTPVPSPGHSRRSSVSGSHSPVVLHYEDAVTQDGEAGRSPSFEGFFAASPGRDSNDGTQKTINRSPRHSRQSSFSSIQPPAGSGHKDLPEGTGTPDVDSQLTGGTAEK